MPAGALGATLFPSRTWKVSRKFSEQEDRGILANEGVRGQALRWNLNISVMNGVWGSSWASQGRGLAPRPGPEPGTRWKEDQVWVTRGCKTDSCNKMGKF